MENLKIAFWAVVGGFLTTLVQWFFNRKKNTADIQLTEIETVEKATAIWRILAQDMKKEVDELRKIVDELKAENRKLHSEINILKKRA